MNNTMFSTLVNRRMQAKQPYTKLNWIKPNSTSNNQAQYISTGFEFEHGMKIQLGIEFINTPFYTEDFGHKSGLSLSSGNEVSLRVDFNGTYVTYMGSRNMAQNVLHELSLNTGRYSTTFEKTDDFWIFGSKGSSHNRRINCKVYYFRILSSTDEMLMDLIPVKDPNDVVCMYDKVSNQFFYPNTGVLLGE